MPYSDRSEIMQKNGFSTIELLVSFVIISFVSIAMFKTVTDLIDKIDTYEQLSKITIIKGTLSNKIEADLIQKKLYGVNACGCNCYDFIFQDLNTTRLTLNVTTKTIKYGNTTEVLPANYVITNNMSLTENFIVTPASMYNTILKIYIPITNSINNSTFNINIIYQYDSRDMGLLPAFVSKGISSTCP